MFVLVATAYVSVSVYPKEAENPFFLFLNHLSITLVRRKIS